MIMRLIDLIWKLISVLGRSSNGQTLLVAAGWVRGPEAIAGTVDISPGVL
jgi:hypothetical protein